MASKMAVASALQRLELPAPITAAIQQLRERCRKGKKELTPIARIMWTIVITRGAKRAGVIQLDSFVAPLLANEHLPFVIAKEPQRLRQSPRPDGLPRSASLARNDNRGCSLAIPPTFGLVQLSQ